MIHRPEENMGLLKTSMWQNWFDVFGTHLWGTVGQSDAQDRRIVRADPNPTQLWGK
jgi:hypothetical protein